MEHPPKHSGFYMRGGHGMIDGLMGVGLTQGVFHCSLRVCTLGFWAPKQWNMAFNRCIWDPKPRVTNIKGTNSMSLTYGPGAAFAFLTASSLSQLSHDWWLARHVSTSGSLVSAHLPTL